MQPVRSLDWQARQVVHCRTFVALEPACACIGRAIIAPVVVGMQERRKHVMFNWINWN